jgi:hypothetical protein
MDTRKTKVIRTQQVELDSMGEGQATAAVTPDGSTLFVARGTHLARIDTSTLDVRELRSTAGSVSAMGFSPDGTTMWLGGPDSVTAVDVGSGGRRT